jgi:hypothetical protein
MSKRFILLLLSAAVGRMAFSQNIDSLLAVQRKADLREKVYVHFDKSYYNPGETIWFKAYLFAGSETSDASKNFYAELLDEKGAVISQRTSPIYFAGSSGSFAIDSMFAKPFVYFRAYTISMLNSDTTFFYSKAIRILSTKSSLAKTAAPQAPPTLSFMPEGGDLVTGLQSVVAFMAANEQGLPVTASGSVADNTGAKVADFNTLHDGMGRFVLTPQAGKTYTATWRTADGKQYTTSLPAAKEQGVGLRIVEGEGIKRFTLFRTEQADDALKNLHIIAYMNQRLLFQANANLATKTVASGVFPTKELPSGILQVTVFDAAYKPIAERITFVNNHDYEIDGDAFIAQKNFARRGLNAIEISTTDSLPANLSLSVVDADLNERNPMDDNIISHMLLTGELRGKIVNPYYYFFSNDDSAAVKLDMVMMTHGWRRYNWEAVLAGRTTPAKWKDSNYLSLSGTVAGLPPGGYSPDLQLTGILQTADSAKNIVVLPVDRTGKVFTNGLIFYGAAKLFFNFNKKNLSFDKSMLLLDNGLRKGYVKAIPDSTLKINLPDLPPAIVAANNKAYRMSLQASRLMANSKVMSTVTVTARAKTAKEKMEEKYVSGLFSGDAVNFDLVNDPLAGSYMDVFQFLQGRVAGLQINYGGGEPSLSWRGGTPVVYLNEMRADVDMIQATPVSDIAYIKVFRPGSSIVSGGGGGVIAIYTRKGGDSQPDPNGKGLSYISIAGYAPVKQFYSPDYATFSERDAYDDVRSTLYWNPAIFLDKSRKHVRLKFYNNDITKRFRLIMEGVNTEGRMIHVEKVIGE